MRVFIAVLLLLFSFQSWTKADDISDFEIEGMSIGDSLLDYFSKTEIEQFEKDEYKIPEPQKYDRIFILEKEFKQFEYISVDVKKNDKQFIIYGLTGMIDYNDINKCLNQQNEINNDLKNLFIQKGKKSIVPSAYDETGESKQHYITYGLDDGYIMLVCYDMAKHTNIQGGLDLAIRLKEFQYWLN